MYVCVSVVYEHALHGPSTAARSRLNPACTPQGDRQLLNVSPPSVLAAATPLWPAAQGVTSPDFAAGWPLGYTRHWPLHPRSSSHYVVTLTPHPSFFTLHAARTHVQRAQHLLFPLFPHLIQPVHTHTRTVERAHYRYHHCLSP